MTPTRLSRSAIVSFLAITSLPALSSAQVTYTNLTYLSQYPQTGSNPPTITTDHSVTLTLGLTNTDDAADVYVTDNIFLNESLGSPDGLSYFSQAITAPTRGALLAAWPANDYDWTITDGTLGQVTETITQPFGLGDWPAQIPAFSSTTWNTIHGMPTDSPFTLVFNDFTPTPNAQGGTLIVVSEMNGPATPVFENLPPTATSLLILANTLQPNTDYFVSLHFFNTHISNTFEFGTHFLEFQQQTYIAFTTGNGTPSCVADVDDGTGTGSPDGGVTIDDLLYYLNIFNLGSIAADVDDGSGTATPDGGVTIDDLLYFLTRFNAGC
ncbi:MAG: GC-type dockerin domain-anchored protein [Phycisphaerales bacterium]|nr:MAG: hypothetical protein IPK69_07340 [Phycisphaerales bacterium]